MDTQIQITSGQAPVYEVPRRAATPAPAAPPEKPETKPVTEEPAAEARQNNPERSQVTEALAKIQKFVEPMASELQFSVDEESGIRVVKVYDKATQEVIRQIPSAEMLEIAKALDRLQGILLRQKA